MRIYSSSFLSIIFFACLGVLQAGSILKVYYPAGRFVPIVYSSSGDFNELPKQSQTEYIQDGDVCIDTYELEIERRYYVLGTLVTPLVRKFPVKYDYDFVASKNQHEVFIYDNSSLDYMELEPELIPDEEYYVVVERFLAGFLDPHFRVYSYGSRKIFYNFDDQVRYQISVYNKKSDSPSEANKLIFRQEFIFKKPFYENRLIEKRDYKRCRSVTN